MKKNTLYKSGLLLGASILTLTIGSKVGLAQCTGTLDVNCLDHQGNVIPPSNPGYSTFCSDTGAYSAIMGPMPVVTCTTTCPTAPGGGGGGSGGDGSGYLGGGGTYYRSKDDAIASGGSGTRASGVSAEGSYSGGGSSGGGSSSGGGGYSCMVVTHFYKRGLFTKKEWLINKKDALSGRLSQNTIDGYHVWAPYAVLAMRNKPWLENIFFDLFMARSRVIEFEQGRRETAAAKDKIARFILEAPSIIIGKLGFKPDHNYNYDKIYGTYQDVKLAYNKIYIKQPQGMIGW